MGGKDRARGGRNPGRRPPRPRKVLRNQDRHEQSRSLYSESRKSDSHISAHSFSFLLPFAGRICSRGSTAYFCSLIGVLAVAVPWAGLCLEILPAPTPPRPPGPAPPMAPPRLAPPRPDLGPGPAHGPAPPGPAPVLLCRDDPEPVPAARSQRPRDAEQTQRASLGLPWGVRALAGKGPVNWGATSVSLNPGSGLRKGEEPVPSPWFRFSSLRPQRAFEGHRAPVVVKGGV